MENDPDGLRHSTPVGLAEAAQRLSIAVCPYLISTAIISAKNYMSILLFHPKYFHHLITKMINHFHGNPTILRLAEWP